MDDPMCNQKYHLILIWSGKVDCVKNINSKLYFGERTEFNVFMKFFSALWQLIAMHFYDGKGTKLT